MTGPRKDSPSPEADGTSKRRNRRQALALGGAAAAAAAVAALAMDGGKKAQAGHGSHNATSSGSNPAVHGNNTANGPGVQGESQTGPGVRGATHADVAGPGPFFGVAGISLKPGAQWGPPSEENLGNADGVWGASGQGPGVRGMSLAGPGVYGEAPGDAPAVRAVSKFGGPPTPVGDGGLALEVVGKARFSTAGAGVVHGKKRNATVPNPAVTADSHVTVTFTGNNPGKVWVTWVERQPGGGLTVHLSGRVPTDLPFTYLIVEPGT